jgi:hypothetical protein
LTILVCFIASSALANAAFAQFARADWKRWDWSFLYPGDETSSTVARLLQAEGLLQQCSVGLFAADANSPVADDFAANSFSGFGKCQIASVASQFSRGTRWCHQHLLNLSLEFRATWEATLAELKCQAELIGCARAALLETESQRNAREYWSYYEDRDCWLGTSASPIACGKADWKIEVFAKSGWLDEAAESILTSLSETPSEKIAVAGSEVARLLDKTALSVLDFSEQLAGSSRWLQSSPQPMKQTFRLAAASLSRGKNRAEQNRSWLGKHSIQCCESFAMATIQETRGFIGQVERVVRKTLDEATSLLSLLPVEAIGQVFAE